jgi:hypothetical protein
MLRANDLSQSFATESPNQRTLIKPIASRVVPKAREHPQQEPAVPLLNLARGLLRNLRTTRRRYGRPVRQAGDHAAARVTLL